MESGRPPPHGDGGVQLELRVVGEDTGRGLGPGWHPRRPGRMRGGLEGVGRQDGDPLRLRASELAREGRRHGGEVGGGSVGVGLGGGGVAVAGVCGECEPGEADHDSQISHVDEALDCEVDGGSVAHGGTWGADFFNVLLCHGEDCVHQVNLERNVVEVRIFKMTLLGGPGWVGLGWFEFEWGHTMHTRNSESLQEASRAIPISNGGSSSPQHLSKESTRAVGCNVVLEPRFSISSCSVEQDVISVSNFRFFVCLS
jgi:hypothetical protein